MLSRHHDKAKAARGELHDLAFTDGAIAPRVLEDQIEAADAPAISRRHDVVHATLKEREARSLEPTSTAEGAQRPAVAGVIPDQRRHVVDQAGQWIVPT